jgi:hypothetical protein
VTIAPTQRKVDVVIRTVSTGVPDKSRSFDVVLTNADTGEAILSPYKKPIVVTFGVEGDLKCAPGLPSLCDDAPTPPEHEEEATGTTAAERAGFSLAKFTSLDNQDNGETAELVRREILPAIARQTRDQATGIQYLSARFYGAAYPSILLIVRSAAVCRPECPLRIYAFDGREWRQTFEVPASLVGLKKDNSSEFLLELAAMRDTRAGTVTEFFKLNNGRFVRYRRDNPLRRRDAGR